MKAMPITSSYGMGSATGGGMVIMSNSPLFGMRRRELYMLADAWNVPYDKNAPATEMRQLLMQRGIDGSEEPPHSIQAKPKADTVDDILNQYEPSVAPPTAPSVSYEDLNFIGLRRACKRLGIAYSNKDKAKVLLEKLNGQDAS